VGLLLAAPEADRADSVRSFADRRLEMPGRRESGEKLNGSELETLNILESVFIQAPPHRKPDLEKRGL
jgi:hypothetical protein